MSTPKWLVSHAQKFERALEAEQDSMVQMLLSCSISPDGAEEKADICLRRLQQLKDFSLEIQKLEQGRIKIKSTSGPDKAESFLFHLETSNWLGIYQLNPATKTAKGLIAIRKL